MVAGYPSLTAARRGGTREICYAFLPGGLLNLTHGASLGNVTKSQLA